MNKHMRTSLAAFSVLAVAAVGCETDDTLDDAVDETEDTTEDVVDETEDTTEDIIDGDEDTTDGEG